MPRIDLENEATRISDELGKVVFIGALAVSHYAKFRESRDIDLVAGSPPSEERLFELGYRKDASSRNSWYTPRGIKAAFFTKDVGGIPVDWVVKTSMPVNVEKRVIRVIALEGLVIAKHRAGRTQDIADLRRLLAHNGQAIRWDLMSQIGTNLEIAELKRVAWALAP